MVDSFKFKSSKNNMYMYIIYITYVYHTCVDTIHV